YRHLFNPESAILRSIIYYWTCRYEDSRNALADFAERYSESVEALGGFLDRSRLSPETAYTLFENLVSGVSGRALGLPTELLNSAAESEPVLYWREQYAHTILELESLQVEGVFGSKVGQEELQQALETRVRTLRQGIGSQFIAELRLMREHFETL